MSKAELANGKIKLWCDLHSVDSLALNQLKNVARLPWVFHHVAAMPDVHFGKGATVGSVIAMKDALSPAAVGVDIGCGMSALRTNLIASDMPDSLKNIRNSIERSIPVGFNWHKEVPQKSLRAKRHLTHYDELRAPIAKGLKEKALCQLGTLGGGNHFIELCLDEQQALWVMLHSGSRNIGKELADYHIGVAKSLSHNDGLPDPDLAVFLAGTSEMAAYRHDLLWAQQYAFYNRETMLDQIIKDLRYTFPHIEVLDSVQCHHNYVSEETHFGERVLVTRKGAISAKTGQFGIIPGSMGTCSYIVEGLGNPDSFCSASHGAGRRMSRGSAKRSFTISDLEAQTSGVECRKDTGVLDEIPGAYKKIEEVMANQADLVKIKHTLKQVMCIKG